MKLKTLHILNLKRINKLKLLLCTQLCSISKNGILLLIILLIRNKVLTNCSSVPIMST